MWLIWLEHRPVTERMWVRFLVRAHTYVARLIPGPGAGMGTYNPGSRHRSRVWMRTGGNQSINISLSFSLKKAMKKMYWGEDKKKLKIVTKPMNSTI